MSKENKLPLTFNIDKCYFDELSSLKENVKEDDVHNIFTRVSNREIYILSIALTLKYNLTPKKSKKSNTYFRTDSIFFGKDPQATSQLKSLVYSYSKDIKILIPENAQKFYELAEKLANAGMTKTIELLQSKHKIEELLLKEGNKICKSLD